MSDSEGPKTKEELADLLEACRAVQRKWNKWTLITTIPFLLSCTGVLLFSDEGPFFAYALWGRFFIVLWMILLIPFAICIGMSLGMALTGWSYLCKLKKKEKELRSPRS